MEIREVLNDFIRRYDKTFIWVAPPDSSEESLFFVDRITADADKIANLSLSSPEFGKIILNMGTSHTLRFKYPPVGVFQHGTDAFVFRRVPTKQYKHGLCGGNCKTGAVFNRLRGYEGDPELTFDLVADAYSHRVSTFKDSLKMLTSRKYRSVALADNYSIMLSINKDKNYILMYWDLPIAIIDPSNGDIAVVLEAAFNKNISSIRSK